jgi:hypothetical protein
MVLLLLKAAFIFLKDVIDFALFDEKGSHHICSCVQSNHHVLVLL